MVHIASMVFTSKQIQTSKT